MMPIEKTLTSDLQIGDIVAENCYYRVNVAFKRKIQSDTKCYWVLNTGTKYNKKTLDRKIDEYRRQSIEPWNDEHQKSFGKRRLLADVHKLAAEISASDDEDHIN